MSDDDFVFTHRLVVRFSDCDLMGHVNNAVYFTYFEQCRLSWWRSLGDGHGLPGATTIIVHTECDYRAPAFAYEELDVRVSLRKLGRTSITLGYEIVNAVTGQKLADGMSVSVTLDKDTRQPIPVPDATRALLSRAPR